MQSVRFLIPVICLGLIAAGCGSGDTDKAPLATGPTTPQVTASKKPGAAGGGVGTMSAKSMTLGPGASGSQFGAKAGGN